MDIHVRRMAHFSDMNVQATGIATVVRTSGIRSVSISHSAPGHKTLNFRGRTQHALSAFRLDRDFLMFAAWDAHCCDEYRQVTGTSEQAPQLRVQRIVSRSLVRWCDH